MKNKKNLLISGGIILLILILLLISGLGRNGEEEKFVVQKKDLSEVVEISGRVEAKIVSDLGFDVSGTIRDVLVSVNDFVQKGQSLVSLNLGTLPAELESAKADLLLKQAQYDKTNGGSGSISEKQKALVESAYSRLLSDDLVAEPISSTYTQAPPIITGRYLGEEGTYKILIKNEQVNEYEIRVFGLEEVLGVKISKVSQTPLGTKGLFIEFPDPLEEYTGSTWFVHIPNKKSSSYITNYNNYQEALREMTKESGDGVAEAELIKARSNVNKIETQIAERTLRAPFSGVITQVEADPGEAVSVNQKVVSLISPDLGIEIDLPEIDSVRVSVGDVADISFDAIEDKIFKAEIVSMNRTETIVDGVPIYEARLSISEEDPRIVSGMTAEVTIMTDKREGVLSVPTRTLTTKNGKTFVKVLKDEETEEIEVRTGLRSTDGFVEILSGLKEGDIILVSS